jgi:hypothetical protein
MQIGATPNHSLQFLFSQPNFANKYATPFAVVHGIDTVNDE